jgi:hypothetical protein
MAANDAQKAQARHYGALKQEQLFEKAFPHLAGDIRDEAKYAKYLYYKQYQRQESANKKWARQHRDVLLPPGPAAELVVELYLEECLREKQTSPGIV